MLKMQLGYMKKSVNKKSNKSFIHNNLSKTRKSNKINGLNIGNILRITSESSHHLCEEKNYKRIPIIKINS